VQTLQLVREKKTVQSDPIGATVEICTEEDETTTQRVAREAEYVDDMEELPVGIAADSHCWRNVEENLLRGERSPSGRISSQKAA
jgi:hypothetical protein